MIPECRAALVRVTHGRGLVPTRISFRLLSIWKAARLIYINLHERVFRIVVSNIRFTLERTGSCPDASCSPVWPLLSPV